MINRSLAAIVIAASVLGVTQVLADAALDTAPAAVSPVPAATPSDTKRSAYRAYLKAQADVLVGMTRVLATEVRDGNLTAAQSAYAPAHRYLKRIEPVAIILHDLDERMDAPAAGYAGQEADSGFTGFHRVEYGLFKHGSTAGLLSHADRLYSDARELQRQLTRLDPAPEVLFSGAIRLLRDIAATRLAGEAERYSKTDLWDIEANIDGVRQIVTAVQPQRRDNAGLPATPPVHFAKIDALLEKHKDGCGFKTFDNVGQDDRLALKAQIIALADELSTLRRRLAMD